MSEDEITLQREDLIAEYLHAGETDKAMVLIEQGEVDDSLMCYVFFRAIEDRNHRLLRWLIERFIDRLHKPHPPDSPFTSLNYFLRDAARGGNLDAVKMFVEYGADILAPVETPDDITDTAVFSDNVELARWVLDHGSSPNAVREGQVISFPLITAADQKNLPMVQLLVERGAVVNCLNGHGLSPLSYAQMAGSQEVIDYLRSVGAKTPREIRGIPLPNEAR